jgi:glycosyltransferase involved in cell wall biosynthesis
MAQVKQGSFRLWGQTGILSFQKQVELIAKAAKLEGLDVSVVPIEQNIQPLKAVVDKQLEFIVAMPFLMLWVFRVSWQAYAKKSIAYMTCEGTPHINEHQKTLMQQVRVIGVSRWASERLREVGCKVEGWVPHAWDPEEFQLGEEEAKDLRRQYAGKFLVGYVGSPIPRKGLALLGEAAKIIWEKGNKDILFLLHTQRWQDCIIPEGPNVIQRLNFGQFSHDKMVSFYKALDLYVQPSLAEGFCIPLLEAMAAGKPIVSVNGGPMAELNGPDRGYLVPVKELKKQDQGMGQDFWLYYYSPVDLADAILQAFSNSNEREEKAAKALEFAQAYTYDKVYVPLVRRI